MSWHPQAAALAEEATHPRSRWRPLVAATPRHLFVPRWWEETKDGWALCDGPSDEQRRLEAAYQDASLVTRVSRHHADHAEPGDHPHGRPTSSATQPSLTVSMFRHALLDEGDELLEVGTGSGYGTALASRRLGAERVTSMDVDPYLTAAARDRLADIGLAPRVETVDATTGELPGRYDRIVATVAVCPVPTGWLAALRTGGRLVTTIAGTSLLITATKTEDGEARGRVEYAPAGFMHARSGADYPLGAGSLLDRARHPEGEEVRTSPYPVVDVADAWDLSSTLDITIPGIEHHYREEGGLRIAVMAHPDGSWARATGRADEPAVVHQGGPRRLWDVLDRLRTRWLAVGEWPVRGAWVRIRPDGTVLLTRGDWRARIT